MLFGLSLLAAYFIFYILIIREFKELPAAIIPTVSFKVNIYMSKC